MTVILAIVVNFFITSFFMLFFCWTLSTLIPVLPISDTVYEALVIGTMVFLCGAGLTPLGEKIFRWRNGARKPKPNEAERIEPIFSRVAARCGFQRDQFDLCVLDDMEFNAFALGRRTVAITRGAMELPEEEQEAIFAHELGHMRYKDGVKSIVFYMLTTAGRIMLTILNRLGALLARIPFLSVFGLILNWLTVLISHLIMFPLYVGNRFGGRMHEFRADKFAYDNGYGQGLLVFFSRLMTTNVPASGVMNFIMSTHPATGKRIKRLEDLESKYGTADI